MVLSVLVVTAATLLMPTAAGAGSPPGPIRPGQTFFGLVNGLPSGAKIAVACPQAVRPGETGAPVSGQTIAVRSPSPSTVPTGATGTRGRSIVAQFVTSSAAAASSTVTFTRYGSVSLPATLTLPCIGSGTIVFSARPTSPTARPERMMVTYVSPCPGTCADLRH